MEERFGSFLPIFLKNDRGWIIGHNELCMNRCVHVASFFPTVPRFGLDNVHLSETRPFIHTDGKQVPAADDWCPKCQWNLIEMVSRTWKRQRKGNI